MLEVETHQGSIYSDLDVVSQGTKPVQEFLLTGGNQQTKAPHPSHALVLLRLSWQGSLKLTPERYRFPQNHIHYHVNESGSGRIIPILHTSFQSP